MVRCANPLDWLKPRIVAAAFRNGQGTGFFPGVTEGRWDPYKLLRGQGLAAERVWAFRGGDLGGDDLTSIRKPGIRVRDTVIRRSRRGTAEPPPAVGHTPIG
jgi:hypothetical protein